MNKPDATSLVGILDRAHRMSSSDPDDPECWTLYSAARDAIADANERTMVCEPGKAQDAALTVPEHIEAAARSLEQCGPIYHWLAEWVRHYNARPEGPAYIGEMPPSPETAARWWTMYCRACGVEEFMAHDRDDPRLVAHCDDHNRRVHTPPTPRYIEFVIDGPPGPEPGRFVEVEDESGASARPGVWIERPGGHWALRVPLPAPPCACDFPLIGHALDCSLYAPPAALDREKVSAWMDSPTHAPKGTHSPRDGSCVECPWPVHMLPAEDFIDALCEAYRAGELT